MDQIRRRLAQIDRELAGWDYHKQIIGTCPLVFVAVGLMAGILIQHGISGPPTGDSRSRLIWLWLLLLTLTASLAITLFVLQSRGRLAGHVPLFVGLFTTICFACLGAIRLISFHGVAPNDISNLVTDQPRLATIRGTIVSDPVIASDKNWAFARFKFGDPSSSFYLKVAEARTFTGWAKVTGTIRVQVDEPALDLKPPDYVQAYCWLDKFKPPTNPGQFDTATYLARRNVLLAASVKSRDAIRVLQRTEPDIFTRAAKRLRKSATYALTADPRGHEQNTASPRHTTTDDLNDDEPGQEQDTSEYSTMPEVRDDDPSEHEQNTALVQALVLGYRQDIDSRTNNAFRKTGLLHFLSLSGMNVGILVATVWWLCATAGLADKKIRAILCASAIGLFLLVVPPQAPVLRAGIMGWVFCLSYLVRRRPNPVNTLSLAAIVLLLIRPTYLFEAGWQLSFATTLGIILFEPRMQSYVYDKIQSLRQNAGQPQTTDKYPHILRRLTSPIIQLFLIGFAAWVGGAGILLYHFHTITPLGCLWTVLAAPLVSAIMILGLLKIVLYVLLPTASAAAGFGAYWISHGLVHFVRFLARIDFTPIIVGRVPVTLVVFYYFCIFFIAYVYFRNPLIKLILSTAMLLIIAASLGTIKWSGTHRQDLVLTCLDVGHGQAVLVQLPGKENILFDAGSLHISDIGNRIIAPFLNCTGVGRLDAIVIAHSDIDHINAIPEVVQNCPVTVVYANKDFFDRAVNRAPARFLAAQLNEHHVPVQHIAPTLCRSSKAIGQVLWPTDAVLDDGRVSDNDKSTVVLLEYADRRILLCSDIERLAQTEILKLYPTVRADVVVAPHHGSAATAAPAFLEALSPQIVISSCGYQDYQRAVQRDRLTEAHNQSSRRYYTSVNGAVSVSISRKGEIRAKTFRKM